MDLEMRHVEQQTASLEDEAIVAELAETVELQAIKLAALTEDREQLASELQMARAWIRELAAELERADTPREPESVTLRERIDADSVARPT